jgi:hypothetical protein
MAVLCMGLTAMPAQAATLTWGQEAISAARAWLGELLGGWVLAGAPSIAVDDTSGTPTSTPTTDAQLKQHVDNPGQTAMKD